MGTLIKVTSIPFESIRFTQNARLVPSDRVAAERQKALSLHRAYQHQYRGRGSYSGFDFISQVRQAFPSGSPAPVPSQGTGLPQGAASFQAVNQKNSLGSGTASASGYPSVSMTSFTSIDAGESAAPGTASMETVSEYLVQREAFEFRIAKGDFSYIPPLSVTIVTQYPEIRFEYTGEFNYVPPRKNAMGSTIDILA